MEHPGDVQTLKSTSGVRGGVHPGRGVWSHRMSGLDSNGWGEDRVRNSQAPGEATEKVRKTEGRDPLPRNPIAKSQTHEGKKLHAEMEPTRLTTHERH